VTVPFLRYTRPKTIAGKMPSRLDRWLQSAPFQVPEATITDGTANDFPLPPAPTKAPASSPVNQVLFSPTGTPASTTQRLTARVSVKKLKGGKRRITVYGTAPAKAKLRITLRRGKTKAIVRKRTTKLNAYTVSFLVKKRGRYTVKVTTKVGTQRLKATKRKRVR
jgi:hypothetical protein